MIITLKGANFSNSNIGNLYRWNILYSLGRGVSHSGDTSVLKGNAFTVDLTIAEGFELTSEGVSVTMDGVLLSNAVTVTENIINVEITSVTGHVVINVPTVISATNLLDLTTMSNSLRYSPGGYNIVGSSGTKYGLFVIQLDPTSTYHLKLSSGYTGGLFASEPMAGSKTTSEYNLNGAAATGVHIITPTADAYWLALNIPTNEVSDGGTTTLTPNDVWQSAVLYKVE